MKQNKLCTHDTDNSFIGRIQHQLLSMGIHVKWSYINLWASVSLFTDINISWHLVLWNVLYVQAIHEAILVGNMKVSWGRFAHPWKYFIQYIFMLSYGEIFAVNENNYLVKQQNIP